MDFFSLGLHICLEQSNFKSHVAQMVILTSGGSVYVTLGDFPHCDVVKSVTLLSSSLVK